MNKQDIVVKAIRRKVADRMAEYTNDPRYIDDVVEYVIELTKLDVLVDSLRYINQSRNWDNVGNGIFWASTCRHLQDSAEDALMELYKDE